VIESVQQRPDERQTCPDGHVMRWKNQRGSQSQEDDANVFDAAISKQPLQVILGDRIENAEETTNSTYRQNDVSTPPRPTAEEVESKTHKPVHRGTT